ncbi:hypothetical protein O181_035465 [Austropuccinia psidii MF-1]|uniref:Uncharacterized protein n=1 Tax=Austropuccinia psidii MF-1 TaxID=1389203 RepID=A0A9Q3D4T6_9BASI|nr:hypothetical protein [Austropuccinia psidii MF-1]
MMVTRQLRFLILLVLSVWPREKISSKISIQNLQNVISALLGRSHVVVLGQQIPTSRDICGVKKMGLLGKHPVFEGPTPDGTSGYSNLTGSRQRNVARWTNVGGPIPVGGRPIYSRSAVPISRINTEGVVKPIRQISNSPPDLDAEGSDELDGEEVEFVNNPVGHQSSASPSQPPSTRFQSRLIASTPRNFQPTLATIPASLPSIPGLP